MLEYVFFDPRPRDRFVDFAVELGLQPQPETVGEVLQVLLPEDMDEQLAQQIEDFYDQMMELNQSLYEQEADQQDVGYHTAGITVQLQNGDSVYAQVDPELLARIMQVLSPGEFNRVVDAIASAVENPDERSLCQRMREPEQ